MFLNLESREDIQNGKIYDVKIEGVSLVKNYRSQFREKLSNSSYQDLLNDLKEKIKSIEN